MAFWASTGGGITVNAGSEQNVSGWELDSSIIDANNTHSGTGGSTNFEVVNYHNEGSIEIPWSDTELPDTDIGLVRGNKVTIVFQFGNSSKTCTLTNTLILSHRMVSKSADDILRSVVRFKGGVFTPPVT